MKLVVYENDTWINFTPLTYTRPVFELKCGMYSIFERIQNNIKIKEIGLFVRDYLVDLVRTRYSYPVNDLSFLQDDLLIVDGRCLIDADFNFIQGKESAWFSDDELAYAFIKKENVLKHIEKGFESIVQFAKSLPSFKTKTKIMRYLWNLVHENAELLKKDFIMKEKKGIEGKFSSQAVIYGNDDIFVAEGAEVHPFVVIDTNSGPVFIDEGVKVFPFSRIEGPCYIGNNTQIMPGANIREGNTIGPVCRIGGEVEESIIHGYSNKYHDGFIGHAYVGEFVNLGAITTNSDLKNDYTTVSVYVNGKLVDTGDLKVGSFIGDHTKTSIGTFFNTGTSVGLMCNITAGGILPKFFPSFVWYVNNKFMKGFGLEMMIKTARAAMERRNRTLSRQEEDVIRKVYDLTSEMRKAYIAKTLRMKS